MRQKKVVKVKSKKLTITKVNISDFNDFIKAEYDYYPEQIDTIKRTRVPGIPSESGDTHWK